MKERFMRKENYPISLEEILEEIKPQIEANTKTRQILDNQILVNNPKLESKFEDGVRKYWFKPTYVLNKPRDLVALIRDQQSKAHGGILLEDVQDSMPNADEVIKKLGDEIVVLTGKSKKKVLYYADKNSADHIAVEEDLVRYWREVPVDALDENKIEDYLEKQGIASMKDNNGANKDHLPAPGRKSTTKGRQSKKHNDHLKGVLNEYNPDLVKK